LPSVRKDLDPAVAEAEEPVAALLGDERPWLLVGFAGEQVFEERLLGEMELGFRHRIFLDEA
jgi:hypothetical protein